MKPNDIQRGIISVRAEGNPNDLLAGLQKAFEDFKAQHQKQLEDVKAGLPASDHMEKLAKFEAEISGLQAAVDDFNVKLAAGQMGGQGGLRDKEYTEAFQAHMKKGEIQASLNKGQDDEGGYLAPIEWDRTITNKLVEVSPMRRLARVQPVSKGRFSKLFNKRGTSSGWVGETTARTETNTPEFGSLNFSTGEIYANPAATQQMLDDAEVNLETWLAEEVQTEFAYQEGVAFVSGDGTNKPTGILQYVTGAAQAAAHPFGAIELINSGSDTGIESDSLIDLVYALPGAYTGNASFAVNRKTLAAIRKLKDGNGNYLWQPSYVAGQPSTLLGFPVVEVPDMPDVALDAVPLLFGDFRQSYLIVDYIGVRVLRDPYTNKPYVMFYTTKRVGGGLLNPQPMRGLKITDGA